MKLVTILFLQREGQILLAMKKRGFGAGKWNGVGGKVEPNESIVEGAIRECQEEIGVTAHNPKLVGTLQFYELHDPSFHHNCHIFVADSWEGEPTETEEMRPQWYDTEDIPYDEMWPDDQYWLPLLLEGKHFEGVVTLDGNTVVSHAIAPVKIATEQYEAPYPQGNETFAAINQLIWNHLIARDWHRHASRNLATSIALEAGELLEHYQWSDEPVGSKEELASELADVFIYAFEFAQANNIDIAEAIRSKLAEAAKKYPAQHFKGKNKDEKKAAWLTAKTTHRKEGL